MSVQSNQYLIYGARLDFKKYADDEDYERFGRYMDSAFDDTMNPNGLHCLYDGKSGQYIVIGRCLSKSPEGGTVESMEIPSIGPDLAEMTHLLVRAELGIEAPMALHLITHYR